MEPSNKKLEAATFAAGCFWGVESLFRKVRGVKDARVGYTGGRTENPTYKDVCSDTTGHAEAVEITFDPDEVSYEELLKTFWENHDPTTPNRQPARTERDSARSGGGPDVGSQYRSAILYHTPEQRAAAEKSKVKLEKAGTFAHPIATEIVPASAFHRAEEYHQRYFAKNGGGACPATKQASNAASLS